MSQTRKGPGRPKGSKRRIIERATMDEIEAMPALLTTAELAYIMGVTPNHAAYACKRGIFKDVAVKVSQGYTVSKAKALEILGL